MDRGGLGISRLEDLNTGLIMKWIFRFANNRDSLWRKVVSAKSGLDSRCLVPVWFHPQGSLHSLILWVLFMIGIPKLPILFRVDLK